MLNVTASNRNSCDLTGNFVWPFPPNQNPGYAPVKHTVLLLIANSNSMADEESKLLLCCCHCFCCILNVVLCCIQCWKRCKRAFSWKIVSTRDSDVYSDALTSRVSDVYSKAPASNVSDSPVWTRTKIG